MDDFLHNLRSGKLKQSDRGRRDYADYKGPQRRAGSERRKTDYYAKVTGENFALVKDALENLADRQKRIADALTADSGAQSRIADALEAIAAMLGQHLGIEVALPKKHLTAAGGGNAAQASETASMAPAGRRARGPNPAEEAPEDDFSGLQDIIAKMRDDGASWEKIARHLVDEGVPTVSGKGIWRGPAVKKFWETHADSHSS